MGAGDAPIRSNLRFAGCILAVSLTLAATALFQRLSAHEISNEIAATGFVKPANDRTDVLLRLPLAMLVEVDLPKTAAGHLDWVRLPPFLRLAGGAAARAIALHDGDRSLDPSMVAIRVGWPSDRSFLDFDAALAAMREPALPKDALINPNLGFLHVHMVYPAASDPVLRINLAPALGDRLHLGVRLIGADGRTRAYEVRGGRAEVRLDPRWHHAAGMFVAEGIRHILTGLDHLLFLICLILPFRRRIAALIGVVTAFTIGHSITLVAAALGLISAGPWFPPFVEALIAASILYMAIENVLWARLERRWIVAVGMGLIHGFGFANALGETLQFGGGHLALSLLAFNVGIEIGQIAVLCLVVPALHLLFRVQALQRYGILLLSILAGHEAWHWMVERTMQIKLDDLRAIDSTEATTTLAAIAGVGSVVALIWPVATRFARRLRHLA